VCALRFHHLTLMKHHMRFHPKRSHPKRSHHHALKLHPAELHTAKGCPSLDRCRILLNSAPPHTPQAQSLLTSTKPSKLPPHCNSNSSTPHLSVHFTPSSHKPTLRTPKKKKTLKNPQNSYNPQKITKNHVKFTKNR
jgi:hypothetical protein